MAWPTTTLPSRLTPNAELNDPSQGTLFGNPPSIRHSAARCQIAAFDTRRASRAVPTIVRPSPLTPVANTPAMDTTPLVGIQ
jgi:hypothetical protein